MKSITTIPLLKQAIAFRDDIAAIETQVKKLSKNSRTVYIDFKEVKFISRSFADELINSMEQFKKSGINVKLKKTIPGVKKMLDMVMFTRKNILRQAGSLKMPVS